MSAANPPTSNPLTAQVATLKQQSPNPLVLVALAIIATVLVMDRLKPPQPVGPVAPVVPSAPADPHFVDLGKQLESRVAPTYAAAWAAFAQALDAGQPFSAALKTLEDKWAAGRQSLTAGLQSELGKIVPPGTKDEAVTPAQRAAASSAARGIAQGLTKSLALPWHFLPLSLPHATEPPPEPAKPIVAGDFDATNARVKLASHSIDPGPESPRVPAPEPASEATTPPPAAEPSREPAPAWHWRYFTADPRIEAYGYLDSNGVFLYTATRWRPGVPAFAPACVGGSCGG